MRKVALLTNIIAPYRIPVYESLAEAFQLTVFVAGTESNRDAWQGAEGLLTRTTVRRSWGSTFSYLRKRDGRIFEHAYFHLTPGYFLDLMQFRPDAIITSEMGFRTIQALLYGMLMRTPIWIWWGGTLHTEREIGLSKKLLRAPLFRLAKHWISYGQTSTEYLVHSGVPRSRILQIQNCVDETLYTRSAKPAFSFETKPVILYVGQLIELKGVQLLLESIKRIQDKGREFTTVLVGDGPEKQNFEEYTTKAGLKDVHFYSSRRPNELPAIYRSADYLLFPTLRDVWGLVVNEALWSDLAVLSSIYAGCTAEIVPPENQFDPLNPDSFDHILEAAVAGSVSPPDTTPLLTYEQVAGKIIDDISKEIE